MKKENIIQLLLAAGLVSPVFTACKEKKQSTDIITTKPKVEAPKPVQEIGDYNQEITAEWGGANYSIEMNRVADRSLPVVEDGQGNKYYDNKITVRIVRKDGSEFFARTFTKNDFSAYVDADFIKRSALLGIVFDKVEDGVLRFAGSVGSPDKTSDEYVPLVLKISRSGSVSISKDTQLDIENPANYEDDEDGV
ncbi:MAG: DUF4738 domain-containing protein [Prevotella sp.]|nr:DUF4738 domain-containing protein [Prevotella sp.]